ncbi:unnamed protein product [Penicillium camemberti]|uniref:Str. FM013 n=1 Tax=Penicillium camemberti (strain FM 013) TaxID=1429867 RepID=A0A0G4PLQ5_PENC3|nr:unnamed protein product [Penicillium camemberti]
MGDPHCPRLASRVFSVLEPQKTEDAGDFVLLDGSYDPRKERVWSRVTAEPTKEPRTKNHRPTMFYLIVLCLAEPLDVFNREETNERKRTSGNEPIEHTRRRIERAVRSPVVSLDSCLADLMRKHAFSIQARATSAKIIYPGPHCICRALRRSLSPS